MSETEIPKIPDVGDYVRGLGKLVAVEDVTPQVKPMTGYVFEILSATVEMWANGNKLKECVTFNDLGGEESCLKSAVEEAESLIEHYGNGVEFRVMKNTDYDCKAPWHEGSNFYDSKFRQFRDMAAFHHGNIYNHMKVPQSKSELYWTSTDGLVEVEETLPPNDDGGCLEM